MRYERQMPPHLTNRETACRSLRYRGLEVRLSDVRAVPFMKMQINAYQLDSRREARIEDQPLPDSWDLNELLG